MNIQEIKLDKACTIFSDSHTNLENIKKLKELYPNNILISLGDFTFLFSKAGEQFNKYSIQYFIDNKIPCLKGNHEDFLIAAETGNGFTLERVRGKISEFDLGAGHIEYLQSLPIGFKLILPDGQNCLLFHHVKNDLWGFNDEGKITEEQFKQFYSIDERTKFVIHGHLHKNFIESYSNIKTKRICIGQLCDGDHHGKNNNGGNYALLTENGIEFKKI